MKVELKNIEMLFECIKKIARKKPDEIRLRYTFYNFGKVNYNEDKCIACLTCYENCPVGAYEVVRKFSLKHVKEANIESLYWKRGIIYQLIREISQKELEGEVEVPEGLPGYGSVRHDENICISCKKCVDLCPTGALSFDNLFNAKKIWR